MHLRQEIYIACIEKCTAQADLGNYTFDLSDESLDDGFWVGTCSDGSYFDFRLYIESDQERNRAFIRFLLPTHF